MRYVTNFAETYSVLPIFDKNMQMKLILTQVYHLKIISKANRPN